MFGYLVFRSEKGVETKSFTQFLDKTSILTIITNISMIFLILISNIYNTTPNKQILISFFNKLSDSSNEKEKTANENKKHSGKTPTHTPIPEKNPTDDEHIKKRIMESDNENEEEEHGKEKLNLSVNPDELVGEIDNRSSFFVFLILRK
jgi:hypothetical protein